MAQRVAPDKQGVISIGKIKENLVTEVALPAPGDGDGSYVVLLKRPKEKQAYPVTARLEGSQLIWTVKTADTAIPGTGKLECRWYGAGGAVAKGETYMVRVTDGLPDPSKPPEEWEGYVAKIANDAKKAASAAEITYSEKVVTVSSVGGILQWAALYPGSLEETPAYVAKGYAAELAECMRYYQRITGMNDDSDVYPVLAYGPAANSSTFRAYIPMPVPMRTMPTLDYSSSLQCQWPNGTTGIDKLALMPEACSTRFLSVLCTSAGLSSGVVYALRGNNDKAAYISFCADL